MVRVAVGVARQGWTDGLFGCPIVHAALPAQSLVWLVIWPSVAQFQVAPGPLPRSPSVPLPSDQPTSSGCTSTVRPAGPQLLPLSTMASLSVADRIWRPAVVAASVA